MILVRIHHRTALHLPMALSDATETVAIDELPCTIGRSAKNDVVIGDETVSAKHALIEQRDDGLYIIDLRSRNGIMRDGAAVTIERISGKSKYLLGEATIEIIVQENLQSTREARPLQAVRRKTTRDFALVSGLLVAGLLTCVLTVAAKKYQTYWLQDEAVEVLTLGMIAFLTILFAAFLLSLFSKINAGRFHYMKLALTLIGAWTFLCFYKMAEPIILFNAGSKVVTRQLPWVVYTLVAWTGLMKFLGLSIPRWPSQRRIATSGLIAVLAVGCVRLVEFYQFQSGDRYAVSDDVGVPLFDPAKRGEPTIGLGRRLQESATRLKRLRKVRLEDLAERGTLDESTKD